MFSFFFIFNFVRFKNYSFLFFIFSWRLFCLTERVFKTTADHKVHCQIFTARRSSANYLHCKIEWRCLPQTFARTSHFSAQSCLSPFISTRLSQFVSITAQTSSGRTSDPKPQPGAKKQHLQAKNHGLSNSRSSADRPPATPANTLRPPLRRQRCPGRRREFAWGRADHRSEPRAAERGTRICRWPEVGPVSARARQSGPWGSAEGGDSGEKVLDPGNWGEVFFYNQFRP